MPTPALPESQVKSRKTAFWVLIVIYGLALLAWPFVAFIALFIFADQRGNPLLNVGMAVSIWMYPLLFIIGWRWGHYRRNRTLSGVILKTSVSLLSAIWYFLLPGGIIMGRQLLFAKSVNIAELENQRSALKERLDPIYQNKRASIELRNPEADAREAMQGGSIAYLPSTPDGDFFPGLENHANDRSRAADNNRVVAKSPLLSALAKQLGDDPSHSIAADSYFSPIYHEYLDAKFKYMERFNRFIHQQASRGQK